MVGDDISVRMSEFVRSPSFLSSLLMSIRYRASEVDVMLSAAVLLTFVVDTAPKGPARCSLQKRNSGVVVNECVHFVHKRYEVTTMAPEHEESIRHMLEMFCHQELERGDAASGCSGARS